MRNEFEKETTQGKKRAKSLSYAFLTFAVALTSLSLTPAVRADIISDIPAKFSLTSAVNTVFSPLRSTPNVLGTVEQQSKDLKAFTKWSDMFKRFDAELQTEAGQKVLDTWRSRLTGYEGRSIRDMATGVNDLVNEVKYVTDNNNWNKSDYWATPIEFLKRGAGDCEDFAIAKYAALRALGVPENHLRVAIVHDTVKDIPHAVLIVYAEDGPVILDNQIKSLVDASSAGRYEPIYSINRLSWWLHSTPENTVVAAAY